jgi:hypothetical protein
MRERRFAMKELRSKSSYTRWPHLQLQTSVWPSTHFFAMSTTP